MVAPFARGRGHGGSQRATTIAERLEERGFDVGWQVIHSRVTDPVSKLRALSRGTPALVDVHRAPDAVPPGPWEAVLVAHSYLYPYVRRALPAVPAVVDFHNLEWRHLADTARLERRQSPRAAPRHVYLRAQVATMLRFEARLVRQAPAVVFVSQSDLQWARGVAPATRSVVVPSLLPGDDERTAVRIAAQRAPEPGHLVYVGTLSFPPNMLSLRRFLADAWPRIRAALAGARLTVIGECPWAGQVELTRHPGVRALGFVDDLAPILSRCAAVVMPFDGKAGTSLRAVFFALAGLPVIGSRDAFRGVPFHAGIAVDTPDQWARAVAQTMEGCGPWVSSADRTRLAAEAHQRQLGPWDRLAGLLDEVAGTPARTAAEVKVASE